MPPFVWSCLQETKIEVLEGNGNKWHVEEVPGGMCIPTLQVYIHGRPCNTYSRSSQSWHWILGTVPWHIDLPPTQKTCLQKSYKHLFWQSFLTFVTHESLSLPFPPNRPPHRYTHPCGHLCCTNTIHASLMSPPPKPHLVPVLHPIAQNIWIHTCLYIYACIHRLYVCA